MFIEIIKGLPEATTQLAKISKLLLVMETGTLANLQGKTLEEIEIEGIFQSSMYLFRLASLFVTELVLIFFLDNLELTDSESEQSEVDWDPSPLANVPQCSKNQEPNDSSHGMNLIIAKAILFLKLDTCMFCLFIQLQMVQEK